jgi:hypothetical protein
MSRLERICSHVCAGTAAQRWKISDTPSGAASSLAAAAPGSPCTPEMVASFRAHGFLLIPSLIPASELAAVDADSLALIEKGRGGPFGDGRWNCKNNQQSPEQHGLRLTST